jgi:deoxyribonuclease IV
MPKNEKPPLGAHMSVSGGLYKALERGEKAGCLVIQIFTRNPNQWKNKALSKEEIDTFHTIGERTSVRPVSVHNSYLINLASSRDDVAEKSFSAMLDELKRTDLLRIPYLVIHPGAHLGDGERRGLLRVAEALNGLIDRTEGNEVKILLETTAGQGTNLGHRFEHLAEIIEMTESRNRLGVCFDTCHAFAAGYDIRTPDSYGEVFRTFDGTIGLDRLMLFHINDAKTVLGSRVDRHEHPGKGEIGLTAFSQLINDPRFGTTPFLLETPKGEDERGRDMDTVNLALLRSLKEENRRNDRF